MADTLTENNTPTSAAAVKHARATVLCPLHYEYQQLHKAGISDIAEIICCGPGPENITHWAEREGSQRERVILAGLAGGLRDSVQTGQAYIASQVVSSDGRRFTSSLQLNYQGDPRNKPKRISVTSVEHPVTDSEGKQALTEKTGADVVDCESAIFAEAAGIFGWQWGIVRGISDDHNTNLPHDIRKWIDEHGKTRTWRVAGGLIFRPWLISNVLTLRYQSKLAMQSVADVLQLIISNDSSAKSDYMN